MIPWIDGEYVTPSALNAHGVSVTSTAGFSTNTINSDSGQTITFFNQSGATVVLLAERLVATNVQIQSGGFFTLGSLSGATRLQLSGSGFGVLNATNNFAPFSAASFLASDGASAGPGIGFVSETSLGFFRSGASTLRQSYGTFDLRNAALSVRTSTSAASVSNLTNGELCFMEMSQTSARLAVRSGNTVYFWSNTGNSN